MSNTSPIYNNRIIKIYLEYLSKHYPDVDIDSLLDYAKMGKPEVEDPAHWFNQHQVDLFHEILNSKTKNPNISREAGRYAALSKASNPLRQYVLGFLTPGYAYSMIERIVSKLSRGHTYKTTQIASNKVEITVTTKSGVQEKPYQCENRMGSFESIAKLFTNKLAEIEHPLCLHKGDDCCHYIITWERVPSLIWKRVRNCSLLLSISACLALFFVLPITPWAVISLLLALLTLIFSFYTGYLEKKELTKIIEAQGNLSKDFLDQMDIRYNNVLLFQEIGHETSKVLDIDKLINIVVTIMERCLDFDRGMIMLANQEKTQLVYAGGYGYSKEQEKLLQGAEFHLDRPESKGVFVSAFRKQKPFLINDIAENEKELSKRSQELARQMGAQSFICVPIVYENSSLGILAVDNVKSKRRLTQSDISLLMGVASQTAVNIAEAKSFQKLQESEKKYRVLVENAHDAIFILQDGMIKYHNRKTEELTGYSALELAENPFITHIHPDDRNTVIERYKLKLKGEQFPSAYYCRLTNKTAREVCGEVADVAVTWEGKPAVLTFFRDVTQQKKIEAQFRQAQKMEAIGTLAGGIAHDFNNLMTAVLSYSSFLLENLGQDDPMREDIEEIKKAGERATSLTRQLLMFSRKQVLQHKTLDLNNVLAGIEIMLRRMIGEDVKLVTDLDPDLGKIKADLSQIEQLIMNLAVNARQAMPEGGTFIIKAANADLDEHFKGNHSFQLSSGPYVMLAISDTGIGMDKETQSHIFEPFFTTKETGKGTGLGLATVYGIVKQSNGYIFVNSKPEAGTTFTIYLPRIKGGMEEMQKRHGPKDRPGSSEVVLLVEENDLMRKVM